MPIPKREVTVMGVDASQKGTALVVIPAGWTPGDWKPLKSVRLDEEGALEGMARTAAIVERIDERISVYAVDRVFIEDYAFSFSANSITKIAEVVGAIRLMLWQTHRMTMPAIVASHARKVMFGKMPRMGRKEWKAAIKTAFEMMKSPLETEDERDAMIIANSARFDLGLPALATSV